MSGSCNEAYCFDQVKMFLICQNLAGNKMYNIYVHFWLGVDVQKTVQNRAIDHVGLLKERLAESC